MDLNPTEDIVIRKLFDFAKENWDAFIQRCEEIGMTEEEVDEALESVEKKLERGI